MRLDAVVDVPTTAFFCSFGCEFFLYPLSKIRLFSQNFNLKFNKLF